VIRIRLGLIALLGAALYACGGSTTVDSSGPTVVATANENSETATVEATATELATPAETQVKSEYPRLGAYTGVAHTAEEPSFDALTGAAAHFGQLGNSTYRIEVPDNWNGDLVVWAHGFKGFSTVLDVDSPPRALREQLIGEGYAWAASSYSENGYAPGIGADDTLAVRDYFIGEFGQPGRIYLVGASMGGNVVALSLEHFAGAYDGALAICGALGGQTQIDFLVSWAHLAAFFAGVELPLEEGALAVTLALTNQVSPALGTPDAPTPAGLQFQSAVRLLTGGPRPFFLEGFAEQYLVNFGYILSDPGLETVTARAATNAETTYAIEEGLGLTADEINAGIYRQVADPEARNATNHPDKVPTSGRLTAPLLTLHNTGDLFVPISQEQEYLAAATAAGAAELLVQRAIRASGHCQFSDDELTTAFDDLVAWVEEGVRPAGDDFSGNLAEIGTSFTDPIRPADPGTP
jgi:pimeloyl-ACP methyl ester carboxylesterase